MSRWKDHLTQGITLLTRLREMGLPEGPDEEGDILLALCHLLLFRSRH